LQKNNKKNLNLLQINKLKKIKNKQKNQKKIISKNKIIYKKNKLF